MIAYEFYCLDPKKQYELIGVLPERRTNPARINKESILNWAKNFFYKPLDINNIFFIKVTIDENTGRVFRHNPFFLIKKKIQ